ncbi:hypothetical protein ASE75_02950 [Sphingomonas sp. Leaf17]|nr:hypothetical protein ASE75_02950 [Sphingomonas sp. Leaf17]
MTNAHIRRRELPPFSALLGFVAAVETSSFSRAAVRTQLTQSAISRQVALLEDWLGIPLFVRHGRRVTPTPAARAYADAIANPIERIRSATAALLAETEARALTIATLPSLGMRWLAPRLPHLSAQHPDLLVSLATRSKPFDFADAPGVDAAFHFGLLDWPGTRHVQLFGEKVIAVCSPALLEQLPVSTAADLTRHTLLVQETRPDEWTRWFAITDAPDTPWRSGPVFEHFLMLAHAAAAGMGVALLPDFLIQPELTSGALVRVLPDILADERGYHLVWPSDRPEHPMLPRFRAWLTEEAAGSQ